jgi:hypothetical protein
MLPPEQSRQRADSSHGLPRRIAANELKIALLVERPLDCQLDDILNLLDGIAAAGRAARRRRRP